MAKSKQSEKAKQIEVKSSCGDLVTINEHFERLVEYMNKIKSDTVEITKDNPTLSKFIASCHIGLSIRTGSHKIKREFGLVRGKPKLEIGEKLRFLDFHLSCEEAISTEEPPRFYFDFMHVRDSLRESIVYNYFLPKFYRRTTISKKFIKKAVLEQFLKWSYHREKRANECLVFEYSYTEPDEFWLGNRKNVKVIVGCERNIIGFLIKQVDLYRNSDLLFVFTKKGNRSRNIESFIAQPNLHKFKRRIFYWNFETLSFFFYLNFRSCVDYIDAILKLGRDKTYRLGEILSSTLDPQHELIQKLRKLPCGDGTRYEDLMREVLDFCFRGEFDPYAIEEQLYNYHGTQRRDFVITNINPKHDFWRELRKYQKAKQILFDAKNYPNPITADVISRATDYLVNPAYGDFLIVLSRNGLKDEHFGELRDRYLSKKEIILVLDENDIVEMIEKKSQKESPTDHIQVKYIDFLNRV